MESYIEITFINNILIALFAYYASAYLSLSKIKNCFFYVFLIIEQLIVVLLYDEDWYFLFYMMDLFFMLIIFFHQYKKLLIYLCIKYLCFLTCLKVWHGSFHLLHYFVPLQANMIGAWLLLVVAIIFYKQKWSAYLRVSDFIYTISIDCAKPLKIKGYLDTGNQVTCNEIPVLFLDASYDKYFTAMPKATVEVTTLNKKEVLNCYLCKVNINRYKKGVYYICCDKRVNLEWGCQCLLNIEI